jgi:hypothetical protein
MIPVLLIAGGAGLLLALFHSFKDNEHDQSVQLTAAEKAEIARNPDSRRFPGSHFSNAPVPGKLPAGKVPKITKATLSRLRQATGGKDEKPFPPLEDPRKFRQAAAAYRKAGKTQQAVEADAKADALNVLIRAEKRKRGIA